MSDTQITEPTEATDTTNDRRAFLRGAAITAGIATAAVAGTASAASRYEAPGVFGATAFKPIGEKVKVNVTFGARQVPTRKEVYAAIDDILREVGCYNCGFNGFDLRIGVQEQFVDLAGGAVAQIENGQLG